MGYRFTNKKDALRKILPGLGTMGNGRDRRRKWVKMAGQRPAHLEENGRRLKRMEELAGKAKEHSGGRLPLAHKSGQSSALRGRMIHL